MSIKVKHGVDPKNTEHLIKMQTGKGLVDFKYRVVAVTGMEKNLPSGELVFFFVYAGDRQEVYPQRHLSLPLSIVHIYCAPVTEEDQFWEFTKQTA